GRRLFGEEFKAGRGYQPGPKPEPARTGQPPVTPPSSATVEENEVPGTAEPAAVPNVKTIADVPHEYRIARSADEQRALLKALKEHTSIGMGVQCDTNDPKQARLSGLAFSWSAHTGWFVPFSPGSGGNTGLELFREVLESDAIEKVGHDLKSAFNVLRWQGIG